jgi:hypothetical protein
MEFSTAYSKSQFELLREYLEQQLPRSVAPDGTSENSHSIDGEETHKRIKEQQDEQSPIHSYKRIPPRMPQYYYTNTWQNHKDYFFVYTPGGITIVRVPQAQLGHGVLGVAYVGHGLIKIADHLFGLDFEEVKKHEIIHLTYPFLTEYEVRQKTKSELPFTPRYH